MNFLAVISNDNELAKALIAAKANVNFTYDRADLTVLHIAIEKRNAELVEVLLE